MGPTAAVRARQCILSAAAGHRPARACNL